MLMMKTKRGAATLTEPALSVVAEGFNLSLARKRVRNGHFFITHSLHLPQGWSPLLLLSC